MLTSIFLVLQNDLELAPMTPSLMLWLILMLTLILRLIIVVKIDALILMVIFYIGIVDVVFVDIDADLNEFDIVACCH